MNPVLKVENLKISFANAAVKTVVNELSFVLYPKSTLAIVGESGSGKSITALALMGMALVMLLQDLQPMTSSESSATEQA